MESAKEWNGLSVLRAAIDLPNAIDDFEYLDQRLLLIALLGNRIAVQNLSRSPSPALRALHGYPHHECSAGFNAQFAEDVFQMLLDRPRTDLKQLTDFCIRLAGGHEGHDFPFAPG